MRPNGIVRITCFEMISRSVQSRELCGDNVQCKQINSSFFDCYSLRPLLRKIKISIKSYYKLIFIEYISQR